MNTAVESISEWFGGIPATPRPMGPPPVPQRRNRGAHIKPKEEMSHADTAGSTHGEGVEVPVVKTSQASSGGMVSC